MNNSTAPDTRPRCGGTPGKPGVIEMMSPMRLRDASYVCKGCSDCQPAPTPSGDDARLWETLAVALFSASGPGTQRKVDEAKRAIIDAIRAESAAALLEAHERLTRAETWWGHEESQRKAAEARLREVEGALERWTTARKAWLESAANDYSRLEDVYASETDALYTTAATPSTDEEGRA